MKKLKKLAALVLAAAMVLAMGMTSFAAEKGTITIKNTGGYAADGVTFSAYKVFDVTKSGVNYGYTMTALAKAFFATKDVTTDNEAYQYVNTNPGTFRDDMATYIIRQGTTYSADATATGAVAMSPAVDYGYYIIVPTKANALDEKISPNLVYVGEGNVPVELKGEKPTVEKQVDGKEYTNGQVGDKVTFTLTSKVPDMSSYEADSYVFKFKDTLSKGLKVDTSSVTVTVGGQNYNTNLSGTVEVTTEPESPDGSQQTIMTIDLKEFAKVCANKVGQEIKVTYRAEITDAVDTTNVAPNTVQINYGNNGVEVGGGDTAYTWLYHLEIIKVDKADHPLAGAEFQIFNANEDGTAVEGAALQLVRVSAGDATNPAVYRPALTTETGSQTQTVITPESGKVIIRGLEEGKYFARETKAPAGYNRLEEDKLVTIDPTTDNNGATITYPGEANKVTIENHKGALLPDTGGMGTVIFTVIGLVLILGVGASFVISRKKRA